MDNINITSLDDIELIRCIIKKEKPDYFKAISHQKEKFRIAKNKISKNFEIGYDETFHAISKTEGRILESSLEINELIIKRKGANCIKTKEGEDLYNYDNNKPSGGIIMGENQIEVTMNTESIMDIENIIDVMIQEAKRKISEEIEVLNNMDKQLELLKNFENDIRYRDNNGAYTIKKTKNELRLVHIRKDIESILFKKYFK